MVILRFKTEQILRFTLRFESKQSRKFIWRFKPKKNFEQCLLGFIILVFLICIIFLNSSSSFFCCGHQYINVWGTDRRTNNASHRARCPGEKSRIPAASLGSSIWRNLSLFLKFKPAQKDWKLILRLKLKQKIRV